ncbi:DUF4097 family beta strand repeat-containing protein [Croceivirga thetidis]|uniref:DUF4097 family beta strand repeat protein n=1 Tax=Croceivirga thetidis TaxID=2721623 RepID=A0ABX1GRM8_9FLAO|nr:DUF4097 family beta strand repeat-containing protein [Croceivirga thetidis]NKI32249.1 DUF4097 family beta strand repeat protein [Croceivirga thetidis]
MATLYRTILGAVFMLLSVQFSTAQERVSKMVERNFPLTHGGELILENKYGNISVTGWDQDKVSVKIDIKVNHRKYDTAKDLLGRINPEIKSSTGYISIVSKIANKNTGWFADFFNRTNPIDVDRSRVQIDYEVFLPKKAKLKITNRFGDVVLEDWSGELRTLIEHGDLWINEDLGKADIILKFGKIKARNLNYASLNLKNGELDMQDAKSLRLNSSGTEMSLGQVNSFEIYSNKDDISIDEVGNIYGDLKFSTLHLEQLAQDVDLTLKISDFWVRQISEETNEINIEQESSDINLTVKDFAHRFEATLEQGVVRLPKSFKNVDSKVLDKGKRLREIRATYGESETGLISINGIKGIVTIND